MNQTPTTKQCKICGRDECPTRAESLHPSKVEEKVIIVSHPNDAKLEPWPTPPSIKCKHGRCIDRNCVERYEMPTHIHFCVECAYKPLPKPKPSLGECEHGPYPGIYAGTFIDGKLTCHNCNKEVFNEPPKPSPISDWEMVKEIWNIVKDDSLASSKIGTPAQYTKEKLSNLLSLSHQEAEARVLGRIAEEIRTYPDKVLEMYGGRLPFIVFGTKVTEGEVKSIYIQAFKDIHAVFLRDSQLKPKD